MGASSTEGAATAAGGEEAGTENAPLLEQQEEEEEEEVEVKVRLVSKPLHPDHQKRFTTQLKRARLLRNKVLGIFVCGGLHGISVD